MSNKKGATPMAPFQTNKLIPDILAAKRQLALLGYHQADSVYLRSLPAKALNKWRRRQELEALSGINATATLDTLPTSQPPDRATYFVVNGGGQAMADVTAGRALFLEFDDRPIEDQLSLVASCGLPEPTIQVLTRHSVHTYFRLSEPVPILEWRILQLDAIAWLGCDPAIWDPSRVMRLAGYYHTEINPDTGEWLDPVQCELVSDAGHSYTYSEIRAIVPRQPESALKAMGIKPENLGNGKGQAPSAALPKNTPQLVDGSRQLSDILEADILPRLGPEAIYSWPGHSFQWSGQDKARGCCPWHDSASGSAFHIEPNGSGGAWLWHCPSCDIGGGAVAYRDRLAGGNGEPRGDRFVGIMKELAAEAGVVLPVTTHRETVTGDHAVTLSVTTSKPYTARHTGETVTGDRLLEGTEDLVTDSDWNALKAASQAETFNPFDVLPPALASVANSDAAKLNIDPLALWQYLLPTAASLMGRETQLDMSGWRVPNIVWTMLVQESGNGKTRAKDVVTKAVTDWDAEAWLAYKEEATAYQEALKEYDRAKDNRPEKPEKPKRRKYVYNQATPQGLVRSLADQATGALWCRDELRGLFNSLDQFSGQGEGLEILLETWDGRPTAVDRVDQDNSYFVPENRLSVAGGIQPGVIEKTFDVDDSQGVLARFLVAVPRDLPVKRTVGHAQLETELPALYHHLKTTPWGVITPTPEADSLFTEVVESFGNERAPIPAARPWLRKLAGQTARIALVIHAIECYYQPGKDPATLEADTLERARWMASHYKRHFYNLIGITAGAGLTGILGQIHAMALATPDGVAIRTLYQGIKKIRAYAKMEAIPLALYTTRLCEELAAGGYGSLVQKGKSKIFVANTSPPQSRSPVTVSPESIDIYSAEAVTDRVTDRSPVTVSPMGVTDPPVGVISEEREIKNISSQESPQPPPHRPIEKFLGNSGHGNGAEMLPKIDPDTIEWIESEEEAGHE